MRNKIKQLLKKEGGFTLIELLAVIAILGFIVAISIPLVGNLITNAKSDTDAQQEALVIDAAQMYEIENTIPAAGVTTDTLEKAGFLESDIEDTLTVTKSTVDGKTTYEVN
ncbi:MAG: type II secretion system protein [Trichococcus sp.]|uniref:competence type IV pilus major pilin ComGC n=1 Tax=Trichococcus sp. TaxID=1985464 RepID=UPI003C42306D